MKDRRHTRSFVAGQSNGKPNKHAGHRGTDGRGSQSVGHGGRGGQSEGHGGRGQSGGRGGASERSGGNRNRSPVPSRSLQDRWHAAKKSLKTTQDEIKSRI